MDLWTVPRRGRRSPDVRRRTRGESTLPVTQHIIEVILSKLPIASQFLLRLICKAWNPLILDLISSNTFLVSSKSYEFRLHFVQYTYINSRINFFPFPFHPDLSSNVSIAGSCNGLLCLSKRLKSDKNAAVILNPITNEYFRLPGWEEDLGDGDGTDDDEELTILKLCGLYSYCKLYFYGFGFIPNTKQYKIARVINPIACTNFCTLDVFTSEMSIKWSYVGHMPFNICGHGVYHDGALYWIGYKTMNSIICRLNLEDNKFEQLTSFVWEKGSALSIGSFNGSLYATTVFTGDYRFQVWMMRNDSWIKEFIVTTPPCSKSKWFKQLQLVKFCRDGKILCLVHGFFFVLYDPKTGRITRQLDCIAGDTNKDGENILRVHQIDVFNSNSLQHIFEVAGRNNVGPVDDS